MKISKEDYIDLITNQLADKYGEKFFVKEIYRAFDGANGAYIKAICNNDDTDDFLVFCYRVADDEDAGIQIKDEKYIVVDEYPSAAFQKEFTSLLGEYDESNVYVDSVVSFDGRLPLDDEFKNGMEYCFANDELRAFVVVYVFSRDNQVGSDLVEKAKNLLNHYQPYIADVYHIVSDDSDFDAIKELYRQNKYDFVYFIKSDKVSAHIEAIPYNCNEGLSDKVIIKE